MKPTSMEEAMSDSAWTLLMILLVLFGLLVRAALQLSQEKKNG